MIALARADLEAALALAVEVGAWGASKSPDEFRRLVADRLATLVGCDVSPFVEAWLRDGFEGGVDAHSIEAVLRGVGCDLGPRERTILNLLTPIVTAPYVTARAREELVARRALAEATDTDFLLIGGDGSFRSGSARTIARLHRFFPGWHDERRRPPEPVAALARREGPTPLIVERPEARMVLRRFGIRVGGATLLAVQEQRTHLSRAALTRLGLSDRETDVVGLVVRGRTNRQIARSLALSPHTVRTHLERILDKLGAHGRTEVTAVALEAALLPGWVERDRDGPAIGSSP